MYVDSTREFLEIRKNKRDEARSKLRPIKNYLGTILKDIDLRYDIDTILTLNGINATVNKRKFDKAIEGESEIVNQCYVHNSRLVCYAISDLFTNIVSADNDDLNKELEKHGFSSRESREPFCLVQYWSNSIDDPSDFTDERVNYFFYNELRTHFRQKIEAEVKKQIKRENEQFELDNPLNVGDMDPMLLLLKHVDLATISRDKNIINSPEVMRSLIDSGKIQWREVGKWLYVDREFWDKWGEYVDDLFFGTAHLKRFSDEMMLELMDRIQWKYASKTAIKQYCSEELISELILKGEITKSLK